MGKRREVLPKCPATGKQSERTYERAIARARKVDKTARVYRCPICGFYHMSSMSREENSRHQVDVVALRDDELGEVS